jgi:hypothetical protein
LSLVAEEEVVVVLLVVELLFPSKMAVEEEAVVALKLVHPLVKFNRNVTKKKVLFYTGHLQRSKKNEVTGACLFIHSYQ